jgi:hypothetical protein
VEPVSIFTQISFCLLHHSITSKDFWAHTDLFHVGEHGDLNVSGMFHTPDRELGEIGPRGVDGSSSKHATGMGSVWPGLG